MLSSSNNVPLFHSKIIEEEKIKFQTREYGENQDNNFVHPKHLEKWNYLPACNCLLASLTKNTSMS